MARLFSPVVASLCALLCALPAAAQSDFFRVAPGPLAKPHAKWDSTDGCTQCHQLGGGITDPKCLGCHNHKNLAKAIREGHGLHAGFKRPCIDCHTEHAGVSGNITDWGLVGGRSSFDHRRTGFVLTGSHGRVPCAACHKRRLASGRTSYTGLTTSCDGCHKNPHEFTNAGLRAKCTACHQPGVAVQTMKASKIPFEHGKATGVDLVGKHEKSRCVACHKRGKMGAPVPRTCQACHKSSHDAAISSKPCTTCHSPARAFKRATFDHRKTKFPLDGRHARVRCAKCHSKKKQRPKSACASCHQDPHRKRFTKNTCETCHRAGRFKRLRFDHTAKTRFPLTGKHSGLKCRSCHRGRKPYEFETHQFTKQEQGCKDCHAHQNAHAKDPSGQFHSKPCTACHEEGGSKKKLAFNHNRDARFALTGAHERLRVAGKCEKCHPKKQFRTGKLRCVDCHRDKDPHRGKLGEECARCHIPEKGAPKFDHTTMTRFVRSGAHEKTACDFCHRTAPESGPPRVGWTRGLEVPEKVNRLFPLMGQQCAGCHADQHEGRYGKNCDSCHDSVSFKNVAVSRHEFGPLRLTGVHDTVPCGACHTTNLRLEGLGELCTSCHRDDDAHRNALGPFCADCHTQLDWRPTRFSHVATGFSLHGAHRLADCDGCHGIGIYVGTPTDCQTCHFRDSARATDPLHTSELTACDRCHVPAGFLPARRSHPDYALTGRHNLVSCADCHRSGIYAGTPSACEDCHLSQFLTPSNSPDHVTEGYQTACDECHSTVGWRPATRPQP